jgi:PAS domain S-box-containing protein
MPTRLEEQLRTTLSSIGDAVISTDLDGRIVFANKVAYNLLRAEEGSLIGRDLNHVFRICNEITREKVENPIERVLREGIVVGLANHTVLIATDGTEIPIDDSAAPIRDGAGELHGAVLIFRDITARRHAELNDRLLAAIVESSDDAIISKDLNGIVTSWNRGAEDMFGYTAEEMIGRPIAIIANPEDPGEMPLILDRIRHGEKVDHFHTVRRAKNGTLVNISLTVSPIRDAEERIIGASKVARDITNQLRSQEALAEQNAELMRTNADLNQFAYAVSHDLREPLRNVANYAELLVRRFPDNADGDIERFKTFILQGVTRMDTLLNDLLAYSLLGAPQEKPPMLLDCNEILAKTLQNLHTAIAETGAVITSDSLPQLIAHDGHIGQLFQNLISNAIKYRSDRPPRVHIRVQKQDRDWRFSITDNGIGIDPQYFQKIFGIFKRLHGKAVPGTGIGLAICTKIVERYGGRIWVESQPGQGSTFFFILPMAPLNAAQ